VAGPGQGNERYGHCLAVYGEEQTLIKDTHSENNDRDDTVTASTRTERATGHRSIIHLNLPVEKTAGLFLPNGKTISPGKYNLPFTIELPAVLPSSMKEEFPDGSYCEVKYLLQAEITGSGFFQNDKSDQGITIQARPLQREPILFVAPPSSQPVNFWCCCWHQGSIAVAAKVNDTKMIVAKPSLCIWPVGTNLAAVSVTSMPS
jgi:Arrestin (or S-antigen), N-terminal domain